MPITRFFVTPKARAMNRSGAGHVLPLSGEVLADPCLRIPEFVGVRHQLQVFIVGIRVQATRRVQRHVEQPKLHAVYSATVIARPCQAD